MTLRFINIRFSFQARNSLLIMICCFIAISLHGQSDHGIVPVKVKSFSVEDNTVLDLPAIEIEDYYLFDGDIRIKPNTNDGRGGVAMNLEGYRSKYKWAGSTIPYSIAENHAKHDLILSALTVFNEKTNLCFVQKSNESDYIEFIYDTALANGVSGESYIGRQGGKQELALGASATKGTILHECMHALGFYHEHNRSDRDKHIKINWENVDYRGMGFMQRLTRELAFWKINEAHKMTAGKDGVDLADYDFNSIMHYGPAYFAIKGKKTIEALNGESIGQRNNLSDGDITSINLIYQPCGTGSDVDGIGGQEENSEDNNYTIDATEYPLLDKYNHEYDVELVPQITGVSCWAASAAMLVGWLDEVAIGVEEIVEGVGYWAQYNNERYAVDNRLAASDLNMFEVWGLVPDTRYQFSLESIAELLWNYGPLWVASDENLSGNSNSEAHVRVIGGISGNGSEDGTLLTIYDPWDRNSQRFRPGNNGSIYQETYKEFIEKMRHLIERENSLDAIYLAHLN